MKNPFNPQNLGEAKLKRNVFDLGRNSIFTNDFFKLYPFFCQEIIPGDTVRIDAQIGVRGMPTVFPVQTKCRASMEFYYVRNRTLMDNFEDYIFMTKDIEAPWLRMNEQRAKTMISTGSLGDAFNIPTGYAVGSVQSDISIDSYGFLGSRTQEFEPNTQNYLRYLTGLYDRSLPFIINPTSTDANALRRISYSLGFISNPIKNTFTDNNITIHYTGSVPEVTSLPLYLTFRNSEHIPITTFQCVGNVRASESGYDLVLSYPAQFGRVDLHTLTYNILKLSSSYDFVVSYINYEKVGLTSQLLEVLGLFPFQNPTATKFVLNLDSNSVVDATSDSVISRNPFVGDNPDIRINVLPYRAYEMCCNYYYRNDKNNPYVLNGESQYNEFIPTHDSGPDDNVYDFHYRNWELDRFTSAIQSPQFGEAPLVGLTYSPTSPTADLTFQGSIDGGETRDYTVKVGVNEDGVIDSIVDFDTDVPSSNLQRLQRQIQAGISINDLRITNSFQRFLENTIRRGLRYRNQLKSHFGVSVDYPDIDVPQYIGGASGFLESGQVTNMADSPNAGLGDYVGTLQGGISMRNKITHYCTEHGFIIGIFSLAPIPNYPQSISKVMIKTNPLDYYHPEFGKIGYVPIHYSELSPLQTPSDGSVDDVFGYQKAHYDYMQALDEVHGDFRTNLRDFALSRTFQERPLLSESFTVGKPEQLNDIWVANNIADAYNSTAKFMCSSHVSCIMKREVAMVGTPSLE